MEEGPDFAFDFVELVSVLLLVSGPRQVSPSHWGPVSSSVSQGDKADAFPSSFQCCQAVTRERLLLTHWTPKHLFAK